jgi:hypothetical protein
MILFIIISQPTNLIPIGFSCLFFVSMAMGAVESPTIPSRCPGTEGALGVDQIVSCDHNPLAFLQTGEHGKIPPRSRAYPWFYGHVFSLLHFNIDDLSDPRIQYRGIRNRQNRPTTIRDSQSDINKHSRF